VNIVHIEEDFRFATKAEVRSYDSNDLCEKPHIPGHDFSQLLDQVAGFCTVRGFNRPLVVTTGGTAIWIANNIVNNSFENSLTIYLEKNSFNEKTKFEINKSTNNVNCVEGSTEICVQDIALADFLILACRQGLDGWLTHVANEPVFKRLPKIVYDPLKLLKNFNSFEGKYFMGSCIWVGV
jgi:hypothetical protein